LQEVKKSVIKSQERNYILAFLVDKTCSLSFFLIIVFPEESSRYNLPTTHQ